MNTHLNLISTIITKYENNDFVGVIDAFNEYIYLSEETGIYGGLYDFYIHSLIRLGLLEEARKNIRSMENLFPHHYTPLDLAYRYINADMHEELEDLLQKEKFTAKECYLLGKNCFYQRNYLLAKKLFKIALNSAEVLSNNPKTYLSKIEKCENNSDVFKPIKYNYFKYTGETLKPGHIIRVNKIREKYKHNKNNTDNLKLTRPYLVWKIEDDRIYVFPLSSKLKHDFRDGHILLQENYPTSDYDRKLQDKILCIKEWDVELVDDKLTEEDFRKAIDAMYTIFCYNQSLDRNKIRIFIKAMIKEKGLHYKDIIEIDNYDYKQYYFIISTDEENRIYKGLEVTKNDSNEFNLVSEEVIDINPESNVTDVIKLTKNQNHNLYNQINNTTYYKTRKLVLS